MRYGYACISMQLSYPQKWGNQPRGVNQSQLAVV